MAADTVSAFSPISLNFNKDAINGYSLKSDNDLMFHEEPSAGDIDSHGYYRYYKSKTDVGVQDLQNLRECDEIQSINNNAREKEDLLDRKENIQLNSEEGVLSTDSRKNLFNGDGDITLCNNVEMQEEDGNVAKKKRNAKKRNRSDMPPEELMKLRERERKAQQSRRDRIRAQKRNAQGWHDDDAAWEAFLDQAENTGDAADEKMKAIFASSVPPSMVCSISRDSPKDDVFADDMSPSELSMAMEVKTEFKEEKEESVLSDVSHHHNTLIQKQDSVHSNDTDTNSAGSYHDNQSVHYSSDDKPMDGQHNDEQKENGKKKLSRRHYLPHEELERLRKRERETKRRQRERHRLANMDSTSPVKSTSTLSSNDGEYIDGLNDVELKSSSDAKEYDILPNGEQFKSIEQHHPTESSVVPLVIPPRSGLSTSESHHHAMQPHDHQITNNHHRHYPPVVYMSNNKHSHHHYPNHSPTQYIGEGRHYSDVHFPRYVVEDRHYHSEPYSNADGYKSHVVPHMLPISHRPTMSGSNGLPSPEHKPKGSSTCVSPTNVSSSEKKKLISRNVDRKKLSEEELEDLRRRERDYQRERRARIRLEKAKLQVNHDHYPHKPHEESMSHYYHHTPVHRLHSSLHMYHDEPRDHEKREPIHVIPNYDSDDRLDYRQYSPRCHSVRSADDRKEYGTSLSDSHYEGKRHSSSDDGRDSDLLQVVPKTRDCEDMSVSPPQITPNKGNLSPGSSDSKKSLLEAICPNIKKESEESKESSSNYSGENNDHDDCDDRLVIVQPSVMQSKHETDIKREGDLSPTGDRCKDEADADNMVPSITSTKLSRDDMSLRDKIMEDQLERRRRSNREAQRRRRARLKVQEHPAERQIPTSEVNEYDLGKRSWLLPMYGEDIKLSSHSAHMLPSSKGCCMKMTSPLRPDSLSYHGHRNGKGIHSHNHAYDRYSEHDRYNAHELDHRQVEKHCYYSSHRSPKEVDSHRYPHYFREQSKLERYMHDLPARYHHGNNESLRAHVDDYDVKKHARVPSIDNCDVYDEMRRNEIEKVVQVPPSASVSPSLMSTPRFENGNDLEPSRHYGRKRKQYAPRKVVSSSSASPEEDVDVCTVRESPEEKNLFKEANEEKCGLDDKEFDEEVAVFKDQEPADGIVVFNEGEELPLDKRMYKDGESPVDKYLPQGGESPMHKYDFKDRGESLTERFMIRDSPSTEYTPKELQFNGDGNYEDNVDTQQKFDDLLYPYR